MVNFTINGNAFHCPIDSSSSCSFGFRIPLTLFGTVLDETAQATYKLSVHMKDGKVVDQDVNFYKSPLMTASLAPEEANAKLYGTTSFTVYP